MFFHKLFNPKSLITLVLGFCVANLASAQANCAACPNHSYSVIIIGAGVAGLEAAHYLQQHGVTNYIVLEARDRIGGRAWTVTPWNNTNIDLGASWIHGASPENPLFCLAQRWQLPTKTTNKESAAMYLVDGTETSKTQEKYYADLYKQFENYIEQYQHLNSSQGPDYSTLSVSNAAVNFIQQKQLNTNAEHGFLYQIADNIELEYSADIQNLSLLYFNNDEDMPGPDQLMLCGYKGIINHLAAELVGPILLNHMVTRVDYSNKNHIAVTTNNGEQFFGQYVISTLPVGVLQKGTVSFVPCLPQDKWNAISHMNMGTMDKIVLRFPRVFWDKEEYTSYIPAARWSGTQWINKGKWIEFVNMNFFIHQPILVGIVAGDFAKCLEDKSDQQIVDSAMSVLRKIYGDEIPNPTGHIITRWGKDPFSYGAYSSLRPGAMSDNDDRNILAEPIADRLIFAGEATSEDYSATMQGAYLSGIRAANYVLSGYGYKQYGCSGINFTHRMHGCWGCH